MKLEPEEPVDPSPFVQEGYEAVGAWRLPLTSEDVEAADEIVLPSGAILKR